MMDVAEKPRFEDRVQTVRSALEERWEKETDWVVFYREVLGVGGLLEELFKSSEERQKFGQTDEYIRIQQTLAKLREKSNKAKDTSDESTRVITVRLPESLHEALRNEAYNYKTSMNQLCISKLLQVIDGELVPSDFERRSGERGARNRSSRRNSTGQVAHVEMVVAESTPEEVPSNPLAIGGAPMSNPYTDSMTGGRPF
jgi:predicted HicB family RNase H-like nuclease